MAVVEKTVRKKAVAIFDPDGGVQHRYVTVDEGFDRNGEFVSGTIRDIPTDEEGLKRAFGEANSISTRHIAELKAEKDAEITALRQRISQLERKDEEISALKQRVAQLEATVETLEGKRTRAQQALQ